MRRAYGKMRAWKTTEISTLGCSEIAQIPTLSKQQNYIYALFPPVLLALFKRYGLLSRRGRSLGRVLLRGAPSIYNAAIRDIAEMLMNLWLVDLYFEKIVSPSV